MPISVQEDDDHYIMYTTQHNSLVYTTKDKKNPIQNGRIFIINSY